MEEILKILEEGKTPLAEINKLFEEGVNLAKSCYDMLEESKGKVTVLTAELQKMVEKPFE